MKLTTWAKQTGISYKTALRWFHSGKLPVQARQLSTGTILVQQTRIDPSNKVALYARVSGSGQKKDLEAQLGRLVAFANAHQLEVIQSVAEVGSGLNGRRPRLLKLLADKSTCAIVVEHRDRLMRFGSEYVEAVLQAQGRRLIVIDPKELKEDLVQDMIEVLTSFCARLYGRRSAKYRAQSAITAMAADV